MRPPQTRRARAGREMFAAETRRAILYDTMNSLLYEYDTHLPRIIDATLSLSL